MADATLVLNLACHPRQKNWDFSSLLTQRGSLQVMTINMNMEEDMVEGMLSRITIGEGMAAPSYGPTSFQQEGCIATMPHHQEAQWGTGALACPHHLTVILLLLVSHGSHLRAPEQPAVHVRGALSSGLFRGYSCLSPPIILFLTTIFSHAAVRLLPVQLS